MTITEVTPITTVVFAPFRLHWALETMVGDPGVTGAAPLAGLSKASDTTLRVRSYTMLQALVVLSEVDSSMAMPVMKPEPP